ncbi:MAG: phosphoribosylanthranilate isomerase [Beijerinckiaceae bacterium]
MSGIIKICGLSTPETVRAAVDAGADWIGFVFHAKSPRSVDWDRAHALAQIAGKAVRKVALMVEPDDQAAETWAECIAPDFLQLHGPASATAATPLTETPQRVADLRRHHETKIIKAIGVSAPDDLSVIAPYAAVADHILLDAKPPKGAAYPGGHGQPFDWSILAALPRTQPFILSGGLTPDNVAGAIHAVRGMGLNLTGVDVSSGVESAPGVKDAQKIQNFVAAARAAFGK